MQGDKLTVVVAHRDQLERFGFDLIAWLIERNGGQIVVLSLSAHTRSSDRFHYYLRAIFAVFTTHNGLRKYRDEIAQDTALSDNRAARDVA